MYRMLVWYSRWKKIRRVSHNIAQSNSFWREIVIRNRDLHHPPVRNFIYPSIWRSEFRDRPCYGLLPRRRVSFQSRYLSLPFKVWYYLRLASYSRWIRGFVGHFRLVVQVSTRRRTETRRKRQAVLRHGHASRRPSRASTLPRNNMM